MVDRLRAKSYAPGEFEFNSREKLMEMEALPPFLRALLVTDGTVTKSLEAYFWEVVNVENLGQQVRTLNQDVDWLTLKKGDAALQRRVRLVGAESGNVYVYAESLLRHQLLPDNLRQEIQEGKIGIGELLQECGLETYRELLSFGTEPCGTLNQVFGNQDCDELIYRIYRIVFHHQPMILITEKFPRSLYVKPGRC